MRAPIILACAAFLTGCATDAPPPIPVPQAVQVTAPIVAKCKVIVSPEAAYPDTDSAIAGAGSLTDLAKMYRAGRALREARIAYLKALLKECID